MVQGRKNAQKFYKRCVRYENKKKKNTPVNDFIKVGLKGVYISLIFYPDY